MVLQRMCRLEERRLEEERRYEKVRRIDVLCQEEGERYTTSEMDEYDKKFAEMQKYIPFLEAMIERLQNVKDKSREVQLQKMQSLHGILSNSKRKLKIETLQRCEDVLQKLHNKVEKGNTPGLHFPHKKNDSSSVQASTAADDVRSYVEEVMEESRDIHETPASPSPPVSPDSCSQVAPIIIPTERSLDFDDKSDSKPASPDPIDTLPTKAPIIIPTERTSNDLSPSPTSQRISSKDDVSFTEWEMLEENEGQLSRNKSWQTIVTSGHDVVTSAAKMVGSNLAQNVNDGRTHVPISMHSSSRHVPTVPVPSLGGSRRLSSILEKNRLVGVGLDQVPVDSRPESPMNVPDARLKSPDSDLLFPKHGKNASPRLKDTIPRPCSKPSAPLLLSPPPVSTEPPLSMEDLAELLNEESDNKAEKKGDRLREEPAVKFKKDKQDALNALGASGKDVKPSKSFMLTQEDIDSESERRWEEFDKHIVKMTGRKCLPSGLSATLTTKAEALKPGETKGPPQGILGHGSATFSANMPVDNRNRPSSPGSKLEPRFADNYERHPRQMRDIHGHDKDKANIHIMHCRSDDDMSNPAPMHHGGPSKLDDRNAMLYQRRQGNMGPEMVPPRIDTEFRMEGTEYFNRQVPNQGHWSAMNDFCNNQWPPPPSNFSGMPNSPAQTPYQHPMGMHQEMWNVGSNREPVHMDPHQINEGQLRPNQFPPSMNTNIRPLMSPNTRPQDMNHIPRPDDMSNVDVPNVPAIQPLISPTRFPVGPQYRNFQVENRPYEPPFDRGMEYPHQRQPWDSPVSRPNDVPYRAENEVPCGVMGPSEGPSGPFPRSSTPCPWNRDRDRGGGRGRAGYYNERNRGEPRSNFNRDIRRPEWGRDNHNEWDNCNRFRDARNISDRDPRVRMEHSMMNQSPSQSRDNGTSVRDPRLAKDKHFSTGKGKDNSFNERDPRKRSTGPPFLSSSFRKAKEKTKSPPKPAEGHRRSDVEGNSKQMQEKVAKDKMQSPLESLYGVIDTKAKSAQGYCLQNFKIPKIKRNESSESPTSSNITEEIKECPSEKQEGKQIIKRDKDDISAEVSSSSDGNILLEDWGQGSIVLEKKEELKGENVKEENVKEENSSTVSVEDKTDLNLNESDSAGNDLPKLSETIEKPKKEEVEPEGSKSKDEVTQEWIEALIRKSFEFGEGKKFVEQAKFMQKLGEVLQAKKLKKIKKIIESESESSGSDKDESLETKKVHARKKRRVIVSDSSDEESLAERLGILNATSKQENQDASMDDQKEEANESTKDVIFNIEASDLQASKNDTEEVIVPEGNQSSIQEAEESKDHDVITEKVKEDLTDSKETVKEECTEDKESTSKTPKTKAKRRNSLEMLQQDIKEMFISDGVVAATGHRLCRSQKENQNVAASTSSQSTPIIKKDEPAKIEVDFDAEDSSTSSSKQKKPGKARVSDDSGKPKGKGKKEVQRITRQRSKQYNQSSDSEEDQPLALRTELIQNTSSLSNQEPSNEESEVLRRSKRIINKESIKEPRVVVEKTDISKLDCAKIMFDSSSDESFGIDVSELAAAVDISLHPDKQPELEAVEPTEKKKCNQSSSRKSARKKTAELITESKDDVQFSDEESIISDISMTSSVASGKKAGISTPRLEASSNEELLSNILVGLVSSKNDGDKDSSTADKGSDADIDDDQLPSELNTRKSSLAKKKKKKCNWQMGILSKKKKKKSVTASSPKCDSDLLNTSSESMDISTKPEGSSILEDTVSKESNSSNDMAQNVPEKLGDPVKSTDNSQPVLDDNAKDQKPEELSTSCVSTEKKEPLSKTSVDEKASEVEDDKSKDKSVSNDEKKNKEELDKAVYDLDIKKLVDYAWTGQERYKCLLCFFTGKNIVHHYKLSHPGKEILISRLKASDAEAAIQNAKDDDVENTSSKLITKETCKFRCRFCSLFTEGAAADTMEAFYEHCTTHTGEYRFRCNSCPYQAVAKSSMRTHYYKVCRKFKDTFAETITEDEIPKEDGIYGYLCSNCNYVQLKKFNVDEHISMWHKDDTSVKIIKINMSLDSVKENSNNEVAVLDENVKLERSQSSSEKAETSMNKTATSAEQKDNDVTELETVKNDKTTDKEDKNPKDVIDVKPREEDHSEPQKVHEEKSKSPQTDADSSLPSGNLSVFVCPPELEKKEVEIQLERKKKMQEIIQNIGIRLQKSVSKKGLSIIDKLKDKMRTNLMVANNEMDCNKDPSSPSKTPTNSIGSPSSMPSQNTELTPNLTINLSVEESIVNQALSQETSNDKNNEDSISAMQISNVECDSHFTPEADQTSSKVRDPLAILDEKKNDESDVETSDNENARDAAPIYDSDSSSDQSDSELPTDVNMILKETSNINASSKDPMLTTIQRLAAQLQATKPIEACKDESSSKPEEPKRAFPFGSIPKPPDVVPIASIKRFVGQMENRFHEISQEASDDSNTPKNFIRLRRLSGDKLSVPVQPLGVQEDATPSKNTDAKQPNALEKIKTMLKSDVEEECSFLKIENVVSLAPRADSDGAESPIINDIRKAVETSPGKTKAVSLLKKKPHSPLILKRLSSVTITQPLAKNIQAGQSTPETVKLIPVKSLSPVPVSMTTTQRTTNFIPIAPKSKIIQVDNKISLPLSTSKSTVVTSGNTRTVTVSASPQSSNLNYKIVKVVRTPPILKPKDAVSPPAAAKLKSADAYSAMLKPAKLINLYKCMGRDCRFTSDVLTQYHQHYIQHTNEAEKQKLSPPFDYQKCAYCYMVLEDWNQMKIHIEEKHAHCRYQCISCFYRASVPSYVYIHQTTTHPGHHGILLGKLMKDVPLKEEVNRHDNIHPYVCQHDCGKFFYVPESFVAHLKNKHRSLLSTYKCHVCRGTCIKVEQLLTHYKMHGFYKYQCLYCLNGSDSFSDMHSHLSMFHCNRLPQVLERSLPPQPVRAKDVIDQLVIRTLDDTFKITEEVIDVESDGQDSNKDIVIDIVNASPSHKVVYPKLLKDVTMLSKDENEALNKSLSSLFGTSNNSNGSVNTNFSQQEKSSNENCDDNVTNKTLANVNDADISITSVLNKETPDTSLLDKSNRTGVPSDKSPVDPVEHSKETFDCSDEFVSINLLDNPDFLKKVSSCDASLLGNTAANESKMEDSDIEIVDIDETEAIIPKKNIKSEVTRKDSVESTEKPKVERKEDTKEQQPSTNDVEDSKTSIDIKESSNSTSTKTDKPLTLEDIKDTGFSGTKLYKCGYETCTHGAQTATLLRVHVKDCPLRGDNETLICAHCGKRFMKIGFLLEHLKSHGLKRFGCSLCKMRCTVGYQAMAHMKAKHKYAYSKLVPADPKNPSVDGLFVVQPIHQNGERKGKKRKANTKTTEKEGEKVTTDVEKFTFSPDEIDSLPRQAIYNREVQCAVCPYTTKVRMNIIRHLQLHAKDERVPESGPVNPVPCLDKKERMFDKMVNLASSSHQNGRMGAKPKETNKDNDDEFIPKFVPEHQRYVCGVAECNYLTVDEAMLRCHLKALHSEEQYFRCPHCPQPLPGQEGLNIAIDKMAVHLKMHDTRLYKCSHCNHHHYHRHVVERHLSDKHPEKRPFVKVIRELENTENNQQSIQEELEEEAPDPDGNHWKCNICDYKCVYKAEMVNHASVTHDEKCQYKCSLCSFKTSGKIMFEQHINSKHPNDPNVDYTLTYQRIKGVNKKSTDSMEQTGQEEPFDTTPLWRRDMPRIRHIRGILLEEEDEVSMESSLRPGKRKSDAELPAVKPAKIKAGRSLDETKQTKEKLKRSLTSDKIWTEMESVSDTSSIVDKSKETKAKSGEDLDLESDVGRFGPYGAADGNMYVCTLCTQFKTKYKHDMRDHLYRELNYARWHCKECGYLSVNRNALLKHFNKHHNGERFNHEPLTPDNYIEEWVGTLLKRQTLMIKGLLAKQNAENSASASDSKQSTAKTTSDSKQSTTKTASDPKQPLAKAASDSKQPLAKATSDSKQPFPKATSDSKQSLAKTTSDSKALLTKTRTDSKASSTKTASDSKAPPTKVTGDSKATAGKATQSTATKTPKSTSVPNKPSEVQDNKNQSTEINLETLDETSKGNEPIIVDTKNEKASKKEKAAKVTDSDKAGPEEEQEKPFVCKHCKMTFTRWRGFKLHVQLTHLKRLGYICPYCDRSTNSETLMRQHMRSKHPDCPEKIVQNPAAGGPELPDEFWQEEYGVVFPKRSKKRKRKISGEEVSESDNSHSQMEQQEKCTMCGFSALSLTGLKIHMRIHAPKVTMKCSYCTFTALTKTDIKEHWEHKHPFSPFKFEEIPTAESSGEPSSTPVDKKSVTDDYSDDIEEEQVSEIRNEESIYYCYYCSFRSKTLEAVQNHWNIAHNDAELVNDSGNDLMNSPFRYKEVRVSSDKRIMKAHCSKTQPAESPYELYLQQSQNCDVQELEAMGSNEEGWICQWCNEACDSEVKMKTHHSMFHSHLPLNFKKQDKKIVTKGYACPECPFTTSFINMMKNHVSWHINLFKCKYCDETFSSPSQVSTHNVEKHPNLELKIESIKNYESLAEKIMTKVKWLDADASSTDKDEIIIDSPPKNYAVAKKSTAKSTVRPNLIPYKIKAVARKSTNPHSRYLINNKVNEKQVAKSKQFSYYGVPSSPVNLAKLNTYMVVGGHRMKVNCVTLAQLININPKIVLKDLKYDIKNLAMLKKLK